MADDFIKLETVKFERDGATTFVILNRPEKRNAMSPQLHMDMCDALDWAAEDAETQVVVLTGAGEAFCAGQDLKLYFRDNESNPTKMARARRDAHEWRWNRLSRFPKPTIAMVNGYCFGGGFTPVVACDFAIAADEAVFGLSEVNWGTIPGGMVSWAINQALTYRKAIYYAVTGETFTGKQAADMDFVTLAVPKAKLKDATMKLARSLEQKSPAAVRATKEAVRSTRGMSQEQAMDYLNAKSESAQFRDREDGRGKALTQFIDEKSFKPGFGDFKR